MHGLEQVYVLLEYSNEALNGLPLFDSAGTEVLR